MAKQEWLEYPLLYDSIRSSVFFDEFKVNLVAVINDYRGLGVENEDVLIARVNTLFTQETVPARRDWVIIQDVLHHLAQIKELSKMYHNFFEDINPTLGISDLVKLRAFLDAIQSVPPQPGGLLIDIPIPNITKLNKPTVNISNYRNNLVVNWSLNAESLLIPSGTITGTKSTSEDVKSYTLTIEAGSYNQTYNFNPTASIQAIFLTNWNAYFAIKDLNKVVLNASLTTTDKRGNTNTVSSKFQYPQGVRMQAPITSYQVEMKINQGQWQAMGSPTTTNLTIDSRAYKTGTYTFRVRGLDGLGAYTEWVESDSIYLQYAPDPPDKPSPTATTTSTSINVKWGAVARAEYYVIWTGVEATAKTNTTGSNVYWKKIAATATRDITLTPYSPGTTHTVYVRAENSGGTATGNVQARLKKLVKYTKTYNLTDYRVRNTGYVWRSPWGGYSTTPAHWHISSVTHLRKELYQGGWREPALGYPYLHYRGGGTYRAWDNQLWGNNMTFIYLNYAQMRTDLAGKNINQVTIKLRRSSSTHGYGQGMPLYLYNHNRTDKDATTGLTAYRADSRAVVTYANQHPAYEFGINRNQVDNISNTWTKQLIQNIANGHMTGIALVKYYGNSLSNTPSYSDKAYMSFKPNEFSITVDYLEEE